ncbi:MAG: hypothetical protein LBU37_15485 [Tannerellaceae bacterium]|nr:hypothetical protein [Tannerellaceae bacterium]
MFEYKSDVQKDTMPSCVHYNRTRQAVVGDAAIRKLRAGSTRAMKNFKKGETNTFIEFKRTMGTTVTYNGHNGNLSV